IIPTNFTGHADFDMSTNFSASVTPGTVATNYKVRATSKDNTNFYDEVNLTVLKVDILKNDNYSMDSSTEALNVANYVTTDGLPKDSVTAFGTTCNDPDNFRIEVEDPSASGASVNVKLQVNSGPETTYTLNKKNGAKFRGLFLRLVTDTNDDAASEHGATSDPDNQTILVELGDTVRAKYEPSPGTVCAREQVGRPKSENDNGTSHLKHDLREIKVNIVVFKNNLGTAPSATRAQVEADIATANERLAQSTIRLNSSINMGGTGDLGVNLPTGTGVNIADGFDATTIATITTLTAEEAAVFASKDSDANSIDFFYLESFGAATAAFFGPRGGSWPSVRNGTGGTIAPNNVVVTAQRGVLTLPHEIMHILLNSPHRSGEPITALFQGGTTVDKSVDGTKRIGPYPDAASAGVGSADTITIRSKAESLP
ncbi:MAG: hypothetical protein L6455_02300, partial [Kiritimatiellae bacterium]|nr:hypothetical protein [Kiritimatiellia bacterium]